MVDIIPTTVIAKGIVTCYLPRDATLVWKVTSGIHQINQHKTRNNVVWCGLLPRPNHCCRPCLKLRHECPGVNQHPHATARFPPQHRWLTQGGAIIGVVRKRCTAPQNPTVHHHVPCWNCFKFRPASPTFIKEKNYGWCLTHHSCLLNPHCCW